MLQDQSDLGKCLEFLAAEVACSGLSHCLQHLHTRKDPCSGACRLHFTLNLERSSSYKNRVFEGRSQKLQQHTGTLEHKQHPIRMGQAWPGA